jgi:hypothetical protein
MFKSRAGHGEGFDEARDIFLRPDGTGVEQEGIANLIAFENAVAFAGGSLGSGGLGRVGQAGLEELRIGRVVDQPDAAGGFRNETGDIAQSGAGDGDNTRSAPDAAPQAEWSLRHHRQR